ASQEAVGNTGHPPAHALHPHRVVPGVETGRPVALFPMPESLFSSWPMYRWGPSLVHVSKRLPTAHLMSIISLPTPRGPGRRTFLSQFLSSTTPYPWLCRMTSPSIASFARRSNPRPPYHHPHPPGPPYPHPRPELCPGS
ncbi:hypothetical protein CORC01_05386, partial [Colletotrichum orchidophilum]